MVAVERAGIPAVAIVARSFERAWKSCVDGWGQPSTAFVTIPHATTGQTADFICRMVDEQIIPRLLKTEWHSRKLCEWHFWLSAGGMLVMASDLILGGLFQGWSWAALQPWEASVEVSQPFWAIRLIAGLAIAGGQVVFAYNIYMTWQRSTAVTA